MKLEFFGAAGEVTGSCHILHVGPHKVLLDCGMIQGSRASEERNHEPFPFEASEIDAVVLSHGHIDHSGRLPLLLKRGFSGPIFAQNATQELCRILLEDSADINQRDVEHENRRRRNQDREPLEPLYTQDDVGAVLENLVGLRYREKQEILPGINICFRDAGHILGSAIVEVWLKENAIERKLVFSGDLGQYNTPILHDPEKIEEADLVLMESTYGGRLHRDRVRTVEEIGEVIGAAHAARGNVLIPAFAIGRSQEILYLFGKYYREWGLDRWQVFLDSPMAIEASHIYWDYPHLYDEEATKLRREINEMPRIKNIHLTRTAEESRALNRIENGAIIIAGSGMCNGGRILHHFKHNLWRRECHVMIVGYQAYGSIGRRLVDGADSIRAYGHDVQVRAQIHTVGGLSAHADQDDLARWYQGFKNQPLVYLVHGEIDSAQAFKEKLSVEQGAEVDIAESGQIIDLEA